MRKKSLLLVLVILLLSVMMISCGKKEKVSLEESVTILYNLAFKGDSTGFEKIGMKQEDVDEFYATQKKTNIDAIRNNFVSGGLTISEDNLEKIYVARCNALKKLSVIVEVVNSDGKVSNVKVGTTYINDEEVDEKAANNSIEIVKSEGLTDEQVIKNRLVEVYVNNLIDAYNNVEVSTEYNYLKRQFTLTNGFWETENPSEFGVELGKLVIGRN